MTIEFLDEDESVSTTPTQPSTRRIVFAGEEDVGPESVLPPEPEQPFFALEDAVSAIGTIPEALAVGVPAAFKRLVTGTAMPEESETIERDLEFQERMQREQEDRQAAGKSSVVGEAIRGAAPSAAASGIGLVSAIGGGAAGLLGGPAAKVTVPAGAMAASGIASYRMAASDLLYRSFRELEKSKGSPLTAEEKAKAYEVFLPLAQESGLWEAGPEAVSNVLLAGAGKFIFGFGKPVADRIVKDSIGRVTNQLGKKIAAGTGALAGELAGETTTAVGQFPAQAKTEQFIRTGTTEGAPTEYPGGVTQAFKDVAPSTIALTAGLGLVGGGVKLTTMPFQRQKSPEQIEEDNINLDAEREADNLLIPDNDAESKSIKAQIDSERADLVVKKELYNSLPEGDKARAVLATEIKEYEGRITELDNTLKQRLGLSVTITPVEQRQIELARGLAEPAAVTEEAAVAVTPTEAQVAEAPAVTPAPAAKPVPVTPPPAAAAPAPEVAPAPVEEVEFAELRNLMEKRGQAQSKVKGVKFSKKDEARYNELLPKYRSRLFETITPEADPVVWKDIQGNDIKVSQKGTFYTVENGRVRTGPAFQSEGFIKDVSPQPVSAAVVESNNVQLPEGYTKQGDLYVYQPAAVTAEAKPQRYALQQLGATSGEWRTIQILPNKEAADAEQAKLPKGATGWRIIPEPTAAAPAEAAPTGISVGSRIKLGKSPQTYTVEEVIPQSETERGLGEQFYSVKNERTGEVQTVEAKDLKIVKPSKSTRKMAPVRVEEKATPVPEADRYTFDEAGIRSIEFFGGKAPDGLLIVNDTTNPNYEMKAGYDPETGDIILNRAYIKKGESIEDILTHELGHYIFSDPKFQADFKNFLESMPDDTRAEIEAIINQSYNKDTNQTQIEERQVMAFTALVKASKETLSAWENLKNTIKRWINKIFRTNIKLSDEGAMAVFNVGFKRFKSGERIIRAMEEGTLRTAPEGMTQMDRDYLAAVERGDMETAQRMVDEAAKKAGYDTFATHRTNARFTVFDANKINKRDSGFIGDGFYFSPGGISQSNEGYGRNAYEVYLSGKFLDLNPRTADIDKIQQAVIDQVNEKRVSKGLEKLKTTDTQYQRIVNDFKMDTAMAESGIGAIASAIKKSGYVSTIAKRMGFDGAFEKNEIVVFSPNQIKSADPITYDDAGNVIPLSQRFRATSPDIRRMAAEPSKPAPKGKVTAKAEGGARAEIAALPYGKEKTTPIGINRKTEEIVQKQIFNGASEVSPEKTAEAYDLIDRLLDPKTGGKYADEVNETTRSQMSENEKRQVDETIGAVKLGNELFKYAVNLAAKGDLRMLQYLFEYGNDLATSGTATISTDARNLQARANLASWVRRAAEAQKKGVVNAIAIRIFGPGVTKEQMDSIIEAVNKVNKTKTQEVDKVYDDLEATGKAGGVDILGAVQKAMEKASLESRDPWVMALEVLKGMEGFQKFTYEKPTQNIKSLLQGTPFAKSLANFRKKMEETGGGGLNTTFWKTLSDQENKLGPLGEVDMAINRNLGSIVKDTLIKLGLKGEPPDTKMTLIEQVANILANNDLSNAKMLQADKMISDEIDRRESGALKQAGDNQELKDIIEAEYSALRQAWDEAMSRQLDIPISDATLRRLISNRIRESKTSLNEITDIIVNDSALGNARKEGIVTSIIQQLDGLTPEGDTKKDYTKLRQALVAQFDQMIENSKLKKRMGTALRNLKKESKEDQQAERMIDKLADLQSDVQTWPKTKENKVRDIVNEDLRQKLDLSLKVANKIKTAWKIVLRQKLVDAGVNQDTAERLTEIVWRQHEINYLNRKMKEVETAVTRGSLAPIVEAIKNTPLSQQQDPKWKRKVAFDYLKNAGLDTATANRLADLMDVTLQKVFVQAQEKAFKDIVSKQVKDLNSRRGMERFLKAIRAGALDPEKNMTSELAAQNGWTGFTSEQVAKLNELDTIVNDPDTLDLQRATAFKEIQDIIKTSKLDPTVKEVLSAYYTAQALNGIPTTSVNFFSAVAFSMRNAMTDAIRLAATNPATLPSAFDTFISSWKTYGSEVLFSFKNNVQRRGTVEYLSDDDALLRLYNKGKRQWKEGKRAEGFKNMLFGMMEYVGRWLKALDEGAVSVLEQQGLTRYAMEAMKQAGVSSKDARAAANYVLQQKEMFIVNSIAKGMNKTEAKALSDDVFRGAWVEALSKLKLDSQEVLDSALNDALSVIGRVNNTFDQLRQEQRNLRDNGFVSSYPIGLLERLSEAMNSPNATEGQRVFYRMVFGFAIVPARVMREAAWYSPYGGVRFALNWWAKKRGAALPYAQSLGTDLQFRQRMADTIAGSIVLGAALALGTASVDDPEDEKMFKIVVTGNGPQRKLDPQFYDTWTKKYSRNALHVFIGKTKFKINIERGFEAFAIPFMLAGAMDDWKIRKRFEQSKKTPADLSDASMILGSAFLSFSRRGPFAAYMDGIASSKNSDDLLSSATSFFTFTGKTFVPIVGTSLTRNISDFVSDPVDRTSMEGALWANTPVIGPMMGTKSMNALGETTGAGELSDRFYKLGMPIVFKLPNTPEQNKLRDLIIEKGQGPDIPTRYDARRTMGFELTDKQFEKYVTVYGQTMKKKMLAGYDSLKAQKPTRFVTSLQKYQETARNRAKTAVNNMDKNP